MAEGIAVLAQMRRTECKALRRLNPKGIVPIHSAYAHLLWGQLPQSIVLGQNSADLCFDFVFSLRVINFKKGCAARVMEVSSQVGHSAAGLFYKAFPYQKIIGVHSGR